MISQVPAQSIRGYSMPAAAPAYPPPPYKYVGSHLVSISFKSDAQALAALLPAPLRCIPDQPVGVYVGTLTVVSPLQVTYREVGVMIPVMCGDTPGIYVPYMYLDTAIGILAGREIWGFPKKEAEIELNEQAGAVSAVVRRNGSILMKAAAQLGPKVEPVPQSPPVPWFNLKIIPSVKRGARPDVHQLTSTLMASHVTEMREGRATLEFGSSDLDPLAGLPVLEVVGARFVVNDMSLDYGDVVIDYLAQG